MWKRACASERASERRGGGVKRASEEGGEAKQRKWGVFWMLRLLLRLPGRGCGGGVVRREGGGRFLRMGNCAGIGGRWVLGAGCWVLGAGSRRFTSLLVYFLSLHSFIVGSFVPFYLRCRRNYRFLILI